MKFVQLCEACLTISVITVTVTTTFHQRVSRALIIRIIESAFIHCSCPLSSCSASMATEATLISGERIRKPFPLTITMHLIFITLCAVFPRDFFQMRKHDKWMTSEQAECTGGWNFISRHVVGQKIIKHVPKQVLQ